MHLYHNQIKWNESKKLKPKEYKPYGWWRLAPCHWSGLMLDIVIFRPDKDSVILEMHFYKRQSVSTCCLNSFFFHFFFNKLKMWNEFDGRGVMTFMNQMASPYLNWKCKKFAQLSIVSLLYKFLLRSQSSEIFKCWRLCFIPNSRWNGNMINLFFVLGFLIKSS